MPLRVFAAVEQSLVALMDYRRRSGFDKANLAIAWAKARRPRPCVKPFSSLFWWLPLSWEERLSMGLVCNGYKPWLLRSLGLNNGGEITSVDLKPAVGPDTDLDESRPTKLATAVSKQPRAPMPSLLTEDESTQLSDVEHASTSQARSKSQSQGSAFG